MKHLIESEPEKRYDFIFNVISFFISNYIWRKFSFHLCHLINDFLPFGELVWLFFICLVSLTSNGFISHCSKKRISHLDSFNCYHFLHSVCIVDGFRYLILILLLVTLLVLYYVYVYFCILDT